MTQATADASAGPHQQRYDAIVVGSGMGGGTLAYALKDSGVKVLLVERGGFLPREAQNWDPKAVFEEKRYYNAEPWLDSAGVPFNPGTYYYVGGNTKLYGASLVRFRREDFQAVQHADGTSPQWPQGYDDFAPFYARAEEVYRVHGKQDDDPTLRRDSAFPYAQIGHERPIAQLADAVARQGFTPSNIPLGIDLREGGACIRCKTCDGFPCFVDAKSDADVRCVRPAVESGNVELLTNAYARRILTDEEGARATGVELVVGGRVQHVDADVVVASCGAVNSAALLLRSATPAHPYGLGNSSGVVGRNYMVHNNSIMVAINPLRKNHSVFQKTLYLNDFYLEGTPDHPYPLGHVQLIGKLQGAMIKAQRPHIPTWALDQATARSVDWWLFTEDLPDPDNRVTLTPSGQVQIAWKRNNTRAHDVLVREVRKLLRKAGYPLVISEGTGIEVNSHQAGTIRYGLDPETSVLDADCRSHDVENLFVVDSSFFPSLPVMNPALTIAANAFRVADVIATQCGRCSTDNHDSTTQAAQ